MALQEATEALAGAERALADAKERLATSITDKNVDAVERAEKELRKAQIRVEAHAEQADRQAKEAERVRIAGLEEKRTDARARASHERLLDATAPHRERLLALARDARAEVDAIQALVKASHAAADEEKNLAVSLGTHSEAAIKFPLVRLRNMVGIAIALECHAEDRAWMIGWEPSTWLAPRCTPPSNAPALGEWRRAKEIAAPGAYLPPARSDFATDAPTVNFFDVLPNNTRPARHELDR